MTWYSAWMTLLKKWAGRTTPAIAESFDTSKKSDASPARSEAEEEIPPEIRKRMEELQQEAGPGFEAKVVGRTAVAFCERDEAQVRAEIERRNLSFLLRPDDEDKTGDPYLMTLQMFIMSVIDHTGPSFLMGKKSFCPLCVVREHNDETMVTDWVEGAVDTIWKQMNKAGKVSGTVQ